MEKVAYESLPGFWVTANLYVPANSSGRVPAIVLAPGHGAGGKSENWSWGANFARNGIVVLAYDPIGQGERMHTSILRSRRRSSAARLGNMAKRTSVRC